jgi:hypothetical protein
MQSDDAPPVSGYRYWRVVNMQDRAGADNYRWAVKALQLYTDDDETPQPASDCAKQDSQRRAFSDTVCGSPDVTGPCAAFLSTTDHDDNAVQLGHNSIHWSGGRASGRQAGVSYIAFDFERPVTVTRVRLMQYPGHTTSLSHFWQP